MQHAKTYRSARAFGCLSCKPSSSARSLKRTILIGRAITLKQCYFKLTANDKLFGRRGRRGGEGGGLPHENFVHFVLLGCVWGVTLHCTQRGRRPPYALFMSTETLPELHQADWKSKCRLRTELDGKQNQTVKSVERWTVKSEEIPLPEYEGKCRTAVLLLFS